MVKAGFEIIGDVNQEEVLKKIERIGRICYKSEDKITEGSHIPFVTGLIKRNHLAMLEHASISVLFRTDRGITHEIVRHRMASFAQESTRFCNYSQDKFNNNITFIAPEFWEHQPSDNKETQELKNKSTEIYNNVAKVVEEGYFKLLALGNSPQRARIVLLNGGKSEIVVTANLREWRHIMDLRAVGTTGAPHPQMIEVMRPLLDQFHIYFPVVFGDINY